MLPKHSTIAYPNLIIPRKAKTEKSLHKNTFIEYKVKNSIVRLIDSHDWNAALVAIVFVLSVESGIDHFSVPI